MRNVPLLSDLDDVDLQLLAPLTRQQVIAKRQHVFRADEPAESLYLLLKGRVRLAKLSRDGKEITLAILGAGDLFGEQAICGGGPRGTMSEVLEDATVCSIDRADFEGYVRQRPELALRFMKLLAGRQAEIQDRIEELAFRDVPTRLARLLARLATDHGASVAEGVVIQLPLTHQEVANLIGATRETTTATLNDFRRADMLRLGRKRIVVTDLDRLQATAYGPNQPRGGSRGSGDGNGNRSGNGSGNRT